MNNIHVLDCTLRDGGYINNWQFGKENIVNILKGLEESKVDIIECGYIDDQQKYEDSFSMFSSFEALEKILEGNKQENTLYVAMINYGEYDIDKIPQNNGKGVDGIRVVFHKKNFQSALRDIKAIVDKGYKVFVQPMLTLTYSDKELLQLIEQCNEINAFALYIVDSFGSLNKENLCRMAYLIDHNLNNNIWIGFHAHNNLQLAFSNALSFINCIKKRNMIVDSSIFGMGRGAGNLNTELILDYCNKNFEKTYEIEPLLEVIDNIIINIYNTKYWGYSVAHYLSATNNCHPNYSTYFVNKRTLNIQNINELLSMIPEEKKVGFDKAFAEELYVKFNEREINDKEAFEALRESINNKKVVILAPGKSITKNIDRLNEIINEKNTVSFWVNYYDESLHTDYVFVNNKRRVSKVKNFLIDKSKLILTSNLENEVEAKYVVDYKKLLSKEEGITDNAVIMLINMLRQMGVNSFNIAGFDGYSIEKENNYVSEQLVNGNSVEEIIQRNENITKFIAKLEKEVDINFLTKTKYKR